MLSDGFGHDGADAGDGGDFIFGGALEAAYGTEMLDNQLLALVADALDVVEGGFADFS